MAELPSNVEAIDAALHFSLGLKPFVVLAGPSGWGKTHLLECVSTHMAKEFNIRSGIVNAHDWLNGRHHSEPRRPLILDDVQDAMTGARQKVVLRLSLERRIRAGVPTILAITGDRLTRHHLSFLPTVREWALHELSEPTAAERKIVVDQMAKTEGIQISKFLAKLLATRMKGNGNTYHGAINRLKLSGSHWTTPEEVLRACGLLDPFFADNSAWDLKDKIRRAIGKTAEQYTQMELCGLCCYALLNVAHLGELDVARFCGVEPAKARERAIRFQRTIEESEKHQLAYSHFLETAVESLLEG